MVKRHGGHIEVDSRSGSGTTFWIYLPLIGSEAASEAQSGTRIQVAGALRGHGERILYVDDEPAITKAMQRLLRQLGYAVEGYVPPLQALEAFRTHPDEFDVVITDFSMPDMNGMELAQDVLSLRPSIPIFVTSGADLPAGHDDVRALVRGVLSKATLSEQLARTLYDLFHAPQAESA